MSSTNEVKHATNGISERKLSIPADEGSVCIGFVSEISKARILDEASLSLVRLANSASGAGTTVSSDGHSEKGGSWLKKIPPFLPKPPSRAFK